MVGGRCRAGRCESVPARTLQIPSAAFRPPAPPHAFLACVHVRDAVRGRGVGRRLVEAYAATAHEHGCIFIGGSLALSSDSMGRRAFFEELGFGIRQHDNFGARPVEVPASGAAR
ncbi:MAG: hypothetical protein CMH34_12875 [Microbacterium sp.]|nr:hypothetical protein [Microbacterium sp.]